MILWRISNYATLDGEGGVRAGGRWHHKGYPVVYMAESASLAMLETIVHLGLNDAEIPANYQLLQVSCPDSVAVSSLSDEALQEGWEDDQEATRAVGDEWLASGAGALLRVPSALVPHSFNFVYNPRHPDAGKCSVVSVHTHPFDRRLLPNSSNTTKR